MFRAGAGNGCCPLEHSGRSSSWWATTTNRSSDGPVGAGAVRDVGSTSSGNGAFMEVAVGKAGKEGVVVENEEAVGSMEGGYGGE